MPLSRAEGQAPASRTGRRPLVTVVIPCYNYAHFLDRCVGSVLAQTGVDVKVLVIDDTSTDETPQVLDRLRAGDARVSGRRHEVNQGHIATYNEGLLGWADGDYTVLLSADDLLAPGALHRAAQLFERHPSIGMVYGRGVYYQDHDSLPRTVSLPLGSSRWPGVEWIAGRCRAGHNVISSPEVVVRTAVQHQVGGYRPDLPHAGDLEMWLRIAAVSDIGFVRGRPQAYYRVHAGSMQHAVYGTFLIDLEQRRAVFERFFADHPELPGAAAMHRVARRALARNALVKACRAYDRNQLDSVPHRELAAFAADTVSDIESLTEYHALQRRRLLGPRLCSSTQIFLGTHAVRRTRGWLWRESWKLRGV